jgi:hypothetical protein
VGETVEEVLRVAMVAVIVGDKMVWESAGSACAVSPRKMFCSARY